MTGRAVLDGFTVGVTADRRAEEQCEMLRRRGARVLLGRAVTTLPLAPDAGMRAATEALVATPPDVLVANTGIGIRSWFAAAESWGLGSALLDALGDARILARGPKAAGGVLTAGLSVAWRAPSETLAETIDHVLSSSVRDARVAVQLDGNAEQQDIERLRNAGADVVDVRVYEWTQPADIGPVQHLLAATCDGQVDAVTFTSAAAVGNLFALADTERQLDSLRTAFNERVLAVCVGPVCARAMDIRGANSVYPERPRLGAMVHTLVAELSTRKRYLQLAGRAVVIQGAALTIDGRQSFLTGRERALLEALLAGGGAVVPRVDLMRSVWGTVVHDHALEVTVARLRRRLGSAGTAIRTVLRRGYRLEADPERC